MWFYEMVESQTSFSDKMSLRLVADVIRDGWVTVADITHNTEARDVAVAVWIPDLALARYENVFWFIQRRVAPCRKWTLTFHNVTNIRTTLDSTHNRSETFSVGGMRIVASDSTRIETYDGLEIVIHYSFLSGSRRRTDFISNNRALRTWGIRFGCCGPMEKG